VFNQSRTIHEKRTAATRVVFRVINSIRQQLDYTADPRAIRTLHSPRNVIYIYCNTNICIFTYLLLQRVRIFVGVDLAPRNENENRYAHDRNKSQQPKLSSGTDRLHLHSFPHTGYVLSSSSPIRINLNKKPPRV